MQITKTSHPLLGTLQVPGDKSITHRAVMLGAIAKGTTTVTHYLDGADCRATIACFSRMGIDITRTKDQLLVCGRGLHGLHKPDGILDCKNSGTTTRLISGILAGQPFSSTLSGDASIRRRPMGRIITPLRQMGARVTSETGNGCAPLHITGGNLTGIHYRTPVASAQVKSCILLAGLYADGKTTVTEPFLSRNHSELMLRAFGADVQTKDTSATITPAGELGGSEISVPGDISSAAYFIAAALLIPDSEVILTNVGINPTRDGLLRVCRRMGADIETLAVYDKSAEVTADLRIRYSPLSATVIGGAEIPTLIDELCIIAILAACADGESVIKDAQELKVKESNRLSIMVKGLSDMGVDITETEDGMIIRGGTALHGAVIDSHLDHRVAMSFAIAGLVADGTTRILGSECVDISYPGFYRDLSLLIRH